MNRRNLIKNGILALCSTLLPEILRPLDLDKSFFNHWWYNKIINPPDLPFQWNYYYFENVGDGYQITYYEQPKEPITITLKEDSNDNNS